VAEQNRNSGIPIGVVSFMPWIVFGVASGFNNRRVATGGGLILCLVYLAVLSRRSISIKLPDWTMLTVFVIGAVLTFGLRSPVFPMYSAVIIWTCFALGAWGSIAVGHPFTEVYAREQAPREFWENPVFIRLNLLMTLVWCGLMTVNIGFAVMGVMVGGNLAKPLLSYALPAVLLVSGFVFNGRFPAHYFARSAFQIPPASAPAA
jgi:intracellular septation protein A